MAIACASYNKCMSQNVVTSQALWPHLDSATTFFAEYDTNTNIFYLYAQSKWKMHDAACILRTQRNNVAIRVSTK